VRRGRRQSVNRLVDRTDSEYRRIRTKRWHCGFQQGVKKLESNYKMCVVI